MAITIVTCLIGCSGPSDIPSASEQGGQQLPAPAPVPMTDAVPNEPKRFKISTINAQEITSGVRLGKRETGESDNGRTRIRWPINELDTLEIIGNDQSDADVVAWQCNEYDKAGNFITPIESSNCFVFFESVLKNVVYSPQDVANLLLSKAEPGKHDARISSNNILLETDGRFFFIRNTDHK